MKKKVILVMTPLMLLTSTLVGCKSSTSEFTVKFDTDGGTQIADVKVKKGEKVTRPETDPSKEGYTFDDWYTTKEGNDRFDFDSTINADTTIYAHYDAIPKKFTVKFDTDGGSTIDDVVVNEGEKVTRPANNPTKNKFVFDDWYTTRAAETKFDFDNTTINADTTIFAKWNAVGLDRIEATLKVSKEYHVDDEISKDDIKVTAIYNDQSTKEITDWTCDDFDSYGYYYFEAKGTKKLAINYNGKATSLSIDVGEQTTPYWSNYLEISALSTSEIIVNKKDNPSFPSSGEVKIPRYVRGKHIQHDQSVTLESETRYAVNVVKENAFDSCSLITSVVLPVSIKTINEHAFCKTGITTIEIPSETTYIGANIFESCEVLKSVTFKDVENYWFDESTYLNWQPSSDEELNLEILNYQGGSAKNEVAIENASPYLEKDKTTTMTVDTSEEDTVEWTTSDNSIATVDKGTVKGIKDGLVYIKAKVTSKEGASKSGYVALYVYDDTPEYAQIMDFTIVSGNNVAVRAKSDKTIKGALTIPSEVDGKYVTGGTEGKTYKVTEITNGGFNFQKEITSVIIPYSVKTIKNSAFNMTGCESKLTSLTLSEGLVEICRFAFANISITSLKLPSTVKKVDGFNSCSKLSDVTLNEGLTVIERQAFYCCPIEEIEFPKSLEDIGEISFECTKIQNVNIPANVEHIGRSAFKDVTFGLNSVTFEDTKTDWTITDITKTPEYEFWIPSTDGTVNAAKIKESNVQSFMKNKLKKINLEQIKKGQYIHYRYQVPPELYYGSRYQAIITLVENSYATAYSTNVKFYVEKIAEGDERLSLGYNDLTKDISITKLYLNDKLLYKDYDFYVNNLDKYISFNTGFSIKDVLKIEFQLLSEPEFGMDMWFSD